MKYNIDQQSDLSNRELYRLVNGMNLPVFVKEASMDGPGELDNLAKEAFAAPEFRAYPINTPERAYISHVFFKEKQAGLRRMWGNEYVDKIAQRINTAADQFNITEDLIDYEKQKSVKSAAPISDVIFKVDLGDSQVELFKVKTAAEFETAVHKFAAETNKYPFSWRKQIAHGFVQKAARFNVEELPSIVCKYAGMFYPSASGIKQELWYRATKIQDPAIKEAYLTEFAKQADELSSKEEAFNLAEAVYEVEKEAGVYQNVKVARTLRDPVDAFFTISIEKAAEILNVIKLADGECYTVRELQQIPNDIYKEAFGVDIDVNNEQSLKDILPTMPLSDVTYFKERSKISPLG